MLSASDIVLKYVCPAAGMVIANIMFSAPARDVWQATSKTGQLGNLNPTPWAFMLGNCFGWVTYSLVIQNFFVYFANAPGLILSVWLNMAAVKLQYENHKASEFRKSIIGALRDASSKQFSLSSRNFSVADQRSEIHDSSAPIDPEANGSGENGWLGDYARLIWDVTSQHKPAPAPHERLVLVMVIYWLAIVSVIGFGSDTLSLDTRELIVGVTVNLNLLFFYGAPLSTIAVVLRTRSSASIHIPTMITNTANGIFWCVYGIAVLDYFIAVPNGLGALLGGVQAVLCILLPRKPTADLGAEITMSTPSPSPMNVQPTTSVEKSLDAATSNLASSDHDHTNDRKGEENLAE